MKIDIVFRGPVRPSPEATLHYARTLKDCFVDHDIRTHLWTWDSPNARQIVGCFDHAHLLPEPDTQHLKFPNTAKQFIHLRAATQQPTDADFVFQSRTDTEIEIDPARWLNPGVYTTIHAALDLPNNPNREFINDQFGCGTPEVMKKAFDYQDDATLHRLIAEAYRPEDVMQWIIDMNNVSVIIAPVIRWSLDPNRHG